MTPRPTDAVHWPTPEGPAPRGTLIIVPGRGEQPAIYERFGRRLAADAYVTVAVANPADDPGEARRQVLEVADDPDAPKPLVLVGSDTGALFAAGLVVSGAVAADALVLAGLPTADGSPGGERAGWAAELEDRTACPTHRGRLAGDDLRRGAIYDDIPVGWLEAADLAAVTVPVLGLHGALDAISPLGAARTAYGHASIVELTSVAGGRHDILNDQTHRSVAATVVLFLERLKADRRLVPIARQELSEGVGT